MFSRRDDARLSMRFSFEGQPLEAKAGDSVAAALLAVGVTAGRETPVSGPRPLVPDGRLL